MKTLARAFGLMSMVGVFLLFPPHSDAESLGAMRVNLVQGDVQVKIADTGEWVPASVNMPLVEGDELWVPEGSRGVIQTNNGVYVRLGADTALQILRMDRDSWQFHLAQGDVYVLNRAPNRSVLQFDTPDASIRAFGRSTFRIEIPEGETDVSVFRGSVRTENDGGTTTVRAGSMLALGSDGYAERSPVPPPDDWRRWNARLDRAVLARGRSYGYLPDELRTYSSDFDAGGRWVDVPEYGYCWTPTVGVNSDWAPYRTGRWVWRGGEYVWVGYEPWGWVPYHYGRWAFTVGIGWFWAPPARGDVYWGPGYVGWVRTGDHVAWVPLAPREVYYGRGDYGRYSTNITNVNITQVHVTNVYRNVNVTNSITVVNQATFVTGRPARVDRNVVVSVREDFARRRNIVVGRPPIKPVGTSYIPVIRSIPEAKRPPAAVRKIDVKELKRSRSLVKEPDRSAIRPDAKPRPLDVRSVEKPRSVSERARERKEAPPADRRGPGVLQPGSRPQGVERGGKPGQAIPQEKAKPERPQNVPERGGGRAKTREAPVNKAMPREAPVNKAMPREAPAEKVKLREAPVEKVKLREAPVEKVKPREAPVEKGRPKQETTEKVTREPQRRGGPGDRVEQGGKPTEKAKPARPKAPPEKEHGKVKPRETPVDNVLRGAPRGRPGREEGREDRR